MISSLRVTDKFGHVKDSALFEKSSFFGILVVSVHCYPFGVLLPRFTVISSNVSISRQFYELQNILIRSYITPRSHQPRSQGLFPGLATSSEMI